MVAFLQSIVRIPTVNPPGDCYVDCAERIGVQLREFGYEVRYIAAEGMQEHTQAHPRVNVLGAASQTTAAGPRLHFNGHIDVVPAGAGWTRDPFGADIENGCIYGRGTSDQKAGIAASIFAVEAVRREGIRLQGVIEQSGTVDEESGGFAGMGYLADQGYVRRGLTDYVIITEPLNVDRVCIGHRGVYWFEVTTLGRIAHGSMPFLGVSAIDKMAALISKMDRELRPALAARKTAMPVEPPGARYPSLNINSISGGQPGGGMQTPCVADHCHAVFDRRFLLEEQFPEVKREIETILEECRAADPEFAYRWNDLMVVEPVQTDPASRLVQTMSAAVAAVQSNNTASPPPLIASPGTYDQKHVMRKGLVDQCIAYGPGLLHLAHQPDEYCRIDHLIEGAKAMALTTMRLLGAESA